MWCGWWWRVVRDGLLEGKAGWGGAPLGVNSGA